MIAVSLFASAVRPKIWKMLLDSLEGTSVEYEVVFAGNADPADIPPSDRLRYIHTENIKPAQCYEIARRYCTGETVIWIADDCEFPNDVIGKAYKYWKSRNNKKLVLSVQTKESGYSTLESTLYDMNTHRFFSSDNNSPLMAPIGLMSREYLEDLGGIDRRYICGQYENDIVMRVYEDGGMVELFGDKDCFVDIDHLRKSILLGESTNDKDFLDRPFAKGYHIDRNVLELSWTTFDQIKMFKRLERGERPKTLRECVTRRLDKFEPYEGSLKELLVKSESLNLPGVWV